MSNPTLSELEKAHEAVYTELRPSIVRYTELASKAVELQKAIFLTKLAELFPNAEVVEQPRILSISAQESLQALNEAIKALTTQNVVPSKVVFDPVRNEFHLFSTLPA
jgi:hypothetical protein